MAAVVNETEEIQKAFRPYYEVPLVELLLRSHHVRNSLEPAQVCFVSRSCRTWSSNSVAAPGAGWSGCRRCPSSDFRVC
jgi:hypothetical protein